jgi:aromatic ring-cleaving dioxygenase
MIQICNDTASNFKITFSPDYRKINKNTIFFSHVAHLVLYIRKFSKKKQLSAQKMTKIQVPFCFLLLASIGLISAHPQKYPEWKIAKRSGGELPEILSYHIHCLFVNGDKSVVSEALQLQAKFIKQFKLEQVTHCTSTFDDGRLCMFDLELIPEIDSPFVSGNWAVFVPVEWFPTSNKSKVDNIDLNPKEINTLFQLQAVQWTMQNRGNMSVFVHPNTGAEVSDHARWALW